MENQETLIETQPTVENEQATATHPQQNVLFGSISYADESSYEEFISTMNVSQAVFVLVASANFSQAKGAFSLLESETIATAIRAIRKNSDSQEEPTT